jgi:hypothetical protein
MVKKTGSDLEIKYKKTPDEYYRQFSDYKAPLYDTNFFTSKITQLKKDLKKIGITFYYVEWNKDSLSPYTDDRWFSAHPKIDNFIYTTEKKVYLGSKDKNGYIEIYHDFEEKLIDKFNQIFTSYFPKRTIGFSNYSDSIKVFLEDQKKLKKEKEKIGICCYIVLDKKDNYFIKNGNDAKKFISSLQKKLPKTIGYIDTYYPKFENHSNYICLNINHDKVIDFSNFLKKIQKDKDLPKIVKLKVSY